MTILSALLPRAPADFPCSSPRTGIRQLRTHPEANLSAARARFSRESRCIHQSYLLYRHSFSVDVSSTGIPLNTIYTAGYYPHIVSPEMTEFSAKILTEGSTDVIA